MKKILLFVFTLGFGLLNAQEIQILDSLGQDIKGDTVSISKVLNDADPYMMIKFQYVTIKNNSDSTLHVKVHRDYGSEVQDNTADQMCWGGSCESLQALPRQTSGNSELMDPNEEVQGGGMGFAAYYEPKNVPGDSYFTYTFHDVDFKVSPSSFTIKFTAIEPTGIKEDLNSINLSISPNPVYDQFKLKYDLKENYHQKSIEVVNLIGKVVYNQQVIEKTGIVNIDVAHLQAGIYFVRIKADGNYTATQKLIIR